MNRVRYLVKVLWDSYGDTEERVRDPHGNLVSSEIEGSKFHAPVIDLDVPHRLVPSSTPGHSHLYIDVPMTWFRYKSLLNALVRAGLIDKGWHKQAMLSGKSFVRAEGVRK